MAINSASASTVRKYHIIDYAEVWLDTSETGIEQLSIDQEHLKR